MTGHTTTAQFGSLGDPLPPALARYYDAIDGAHFDEAAAAFASDAVYAVPSPDAAETAPRTTTIGPDGLLERWARRGPQPWRHTVQLCVIEGQNALVEGVLIEGTTATSTFVASVRIGDDGLIERYLAFGCAGAREPMPAGSLPVGVAPGDAADVVHRYFIDLDAGRFGAAAAHFSNDVFYSHPPYQHTGITDHGRVEFRGRAALEAAFHTRGTTTFDHAVLISAQRDAHCILEGVVTNLPRGGDGSFISSLSLAADGTICRYVSFYCEPAVRFQ